MSFKLPFEILHIISSYISRQDILHCLTVCKSWQAPFEDALWETIEIDGYAKMVAICDDSTPISAVYQKNGYRVRKLTLTGHMWIVNEELCTIQKYFQELKHLNIRPNALSWYDFGKTANWDSWRSLARLEINMTELTGGDKEHEILEMLSCLPYLRHLYLDDDLPLKREHFTWVAIERIHIYLPLLEYFEMRSPLVSIPQHDLPEIQHITPANSLTTVKISYRTIDLGWLYYCAIKYPNIHTFGWKLKQDQNNIIYQDTFYDLSDEEDQTENAPVQLGSAQAEQKTVISMFSGLNCFFPCLKTVELSEKPRSEWEHIVFWKLIRQFGALLKCVDYDFDNTHISKEKSEMIMNEYTLSCSKTLEALRLRAEFATLPFILDIHTNPIYPNTYPCLVDLHLSLLNKEIELDLILDHCPVLRWLYLSAHPIIQSTGSMGNPATHGLERIKIEDAKVDWSIFNYLSFRCRSLSHMSLFDVTVCGLISQDTGNLCLDMSHTKFEDLKLLNVDFYSLEDVYTDEFAHINQIISFISFEQTESAKTKSFIQPPNTSERHTLYPEPIWLHNCLSSIDKPYQKLWELERHQIKFAQDYFQSFHSKDRNPAPKDTLSTAYDQEEWNCWKLDLCRGYVTLRCAYSRKHLVDVY
ncbi:hypothetical protein CLU79DRAFT_739298 [Phycomyces nitens]|nr:hypothetical protein CLU79DRAFT_739298 [Phycomyces nitens]